MNIESSREREFILFLHMQKTAGMTLQELLRKHHGKNICKRALQYYKKEIAKKDVQLKAAAEGIEALKESSGNAGLAVKQVIHG